MRCPQETECRAAVDEQAFDSVTVKASEQVPLQEGDIQQALEKTRQPAFFSNHRVMSLVRALPRGRLSKFQPLLPPDLEARFLAERLFDIGGLQVFLGERRATFFGQQKAE